MTKTTGEVAAEMRARGDDKVNAIDMQREMDKTYFEEIDKCIANHTHLTDPYYIVVHHKREKLIVNVIRRYFIGRQSLPTPQWDQTVWRYTPATGSCQFLWTLPDEWTAADMAVFPQKVPLEQHQLLQFVMDCLDGRLYPYYFNLYHKGEDQVEALQDSSYSETGDKAVDRVE